MKETKADSKCPICGNMYWIGALSRRDNKTEICPSCGLREALEDWANHEKEVSHDK